jgi:hypothetical protein
MPDWSTLIIDANCVSGCVNWREYWMKAWTSPIEIAPDATANTADDGDRDVVEVGRGTSAQAGSCPTRTARRSSRRTARRWSP